MGLMRLTYFSTFNINLAKNNTLQHLTDILDSASRNNCKNEITGALIFNENFFVQILEGEREAVWPTFKRIEKDARHSDVTLIEMCLASGRCFGNWWMAYAQLNTSNSHLVAPFEMDGVLDPSKMLPEQILSMMINLTYESSERELNVAGKDMAARLTRERPNLGREIASSL